MRGPLAPSSFVVTRHRRWTGPVLSGVISAGTVNNLVLPLPGGAEQAVLRSDITAMQPVPGSLMPPGLQSALTPQQMADLLQWIRQTK